MKSICLLGATGSIGDNLLDLVRGAAGQFSISCMTAFSQPEKLAALAREFQPGQVVIGDPAHYRQLADLLAGTGIEISAGPEAIAVAAAQPVDLVVAGIVGFAGLPAVMAAISAGQKIALANKEALVVAGHLVMPMLARTKAEIIPVDSEHNAIYQCLAGNNLSDVEKVVLTASGGPFRGYSHDQLAGVTVDQALAHPNWVMGRKISIDSATLMNKGLELIEAAWLFGLAGDRLEAVIHPQSIVHGLVYYCDGSVLAHLGPADMKVPLSHALGWPQRARWPAPQLDLTALGQLEFEPVDSQLFRCFDLARQVIGQPAGRAVVLNAANEIAVEAFLEKRIGFLDIAALIEQVLDKVLEAECSAMDSLIALDNEARQAAKSLIDKQES